MPTTFKEAGHDVYRLMKDVMRQFFAPFTILDPALKIVILMASGNTIPCLKKQGSSVVCDVKITKGEERASTEEPPDVRFLIDWMVYDSSNERRRRAMFARLLSYLEIETHAHESADKLCCDMDDYGRPIVKLKPPDWRTEGFRQVVEWFEADAWEHRELTAIVNDLGQESFQFMKADDDDAASLVNGRVAEIEAEAGEYSTVARDAFGALLSVGHTDQQARDAIDRVLASGKRPSSVADMIDAVYQDSREPRAAVPAPDPLPTSVSFSGKDFDIIAEAGKKLRGKGRREAIVGADASA